MIISEGRKFIFVHIPKTGGTAMATALESRAMKDDILIGDTPKAQNRKARLKSLTPKGRLWKHSTLADIEGIVDPDSLPDFFVFTLVRNPWDRLVSYYHWLQDQTFHHPAVVLAQSLDFSPFLNAPHTVASLSVQTYTSYVRDSRGALQCQLFARLEHLADDLPPLWDYLGFSVDIPVVNASARRLDWRGYYSQGDADLVARIASDDIARFGYRFDSPS